MSMHGETFPQLLIQQAERRPSVTAMREKRFGIWQGSTWADVLKQVRAIAGGLVQAGVIREQHVVVIGANRPRLYATLLAIQSLGAIPILLYEDAAAAELVFPLAHAEVRCAVVEDQEQVDKLLEVRERWPGLTDIWYDDPRGLRNMRDLGVDSLDALIRSGEEWDRQHPGEFEKSVAMGRGPDVAALFFTSGTTGQPKGVMHTYGALVDRSRAGARFDRLDERDEVLAYLPPAWLGQNMFSYAMWLVVGYVVNCPESSETVAIDMREIGPTYYFAPPRFFEGLLTNVMIRMEDTSAVKQRVFRWALAQAARVGQQRMNGESVAWQSRLAYAVGNFLIHAPIRNALGMSRIRVAYTAGEAIGPDLFAFYRSIGINLKQLYGSTETAVFVCLQPDNQVRADTVGVPIENVQIRFTESGELLIRSPGLFKGYYKNPQATGEVLDEEGWFHTGDAGYLEPGGHLKIIDRAKDVGRLESGAMFAPKYVENKLKFFSFIKETVAFGDRRDKVCAMVNIDYRAVGAWAERRNLPYAGYADLAAKAEVYELVRSCIEKANAELAADPALSGNQIHRFLVLHKELDADDGELTRTNKVRRSAVNEMYRPLIDAFYGGLKRQYIETAVKFEDGRTGTVTADLRIEDVKTFPRLGSVA